MKTVVCFAVREEAKPFRRWTGTKAGVEILLTGMGRRNAERSIRAALANSRPELVLSCGFAGGLDPALTLGTVLFALEDNPRLLQLRSRLLGTGARVGLFHCSDRILSAAADKAALRKSTGADAVEMESEAICSVCREQDVPCAIIRVVLDTAAENLALDFNSLLTPEMNMDYAKLAKSLLKSPRKIGALLQLQKQGHIAAERLAEVLKQVCKLPAKIQTHEQ